MMIAHFLVMMSLLGLPSLPEDSNLRIHPILNTAGHYEISSIQGNLFLIRKADRMGEADAVVEPFRLHRSVLVILALLASLYCFSKKNFLRVILTWLISIPATTFLFYSAINIHSPYLFHILSTLLTALVGAAGMRIILGSQKKGTVAAIGVAVAVPITYLILWGCITLSKITGFSIEAINILDYTIRHSFQNSDSILPDYSRIVLLSMLFGAIGSMCDMSADVASGSQEIVKMPKSYLIKGLTRLSDHAIGSMTNTLILAYFGGNLMLILSWLALPEQAPIFWNREIVAIEIIRALGGSFGFIITSIICGLTLRMFHND